VLCADSNQEFGDKNVVPLTLSPPYSAILPSHKIDKSSIAHLSPEQQTELSEVLDAFPECFSDEPGFTDEIGHSITVSDDFQPKRLHAYRVPEKLNRK